MIEKLSDYESAGWLQQAGQFEFEVKKAELKDSKNGTTMVVLECESSEAGKTTLYHSLTAAARWSYNNLIKACLNLTTPEKIRNFELDYEIIHQQLIGKHFIGDVEEQTYEKENKVPNADGVFETTYETKKSYKVVRYYPVEG